MAEQGFEMVRYADDFVVLCRSPEDAAEAHGRGERLDGVSRPDPAPDQDPAGGRQDGWIRRRQRSMLRWHKGMRGIAGVRGEDQVRWPNVFFADHGLFSLQKAYETVRQSPRG
jgi:hypothetical protein